MLALIYSKFIVIMKLVRKKRNTSQASANCSLLPATAIVTGACGTLGQEIAVQLSRKGYHVILGCKDMQRSGILEERIQKDNPAAKVESFSVNLEDATSILQFANDVKSTARARPNLEVVVHNAACLTDELQITADGFERTFATNCLGPFFLTKSLASLFVRSRSPRVVLVSSFTHRSAIRNSYLGWLDWMHKLPRRKAQNSYTPASAYQHSKLASLLLLSKMGETVGKKGFACACDPGAFASTLTREWPVLLVVLYRVVLRFLGLLHRPSHAAEGVVHAVTAESAEPGSYWFDGQIVSPSALVHETHLQNLLEPWLVAFESSVRPLDACTTETRFVPGLKSQTSSGRLDWERKNVGSLSNDGMVPDGTRSMRCPSKVPTVQPRVSLRGTELSSYDSERLADSKHGGRPVGADGRRKQE